MKTHYVKSKGYRFTGCCRDREGVTYSVTTKPRKATCMTCIRHLTIVGLLTKVEFLDRKIRRLKLKRRMATSGLV